MATGADDGELFGDGDEAPIGYALVAVERGLDAPDGGLTYSVPAKLSAIQAGQRVEVPLGRGNKSAAGFVLERLDTPDPTIKVIKPIKATLGEAVSLPGELIRLARWTASYYACPLGMVLQTMLPAAVKRGVGIHAKTMVRKSPDALPLEKPTKLQTAVLDAAPADGWIELRDLADAAGAKTSSPVKRLIDLGQLETQKVRVVDAELEATTPDERNREPLELTSPQQRALDELTDTLGSFQVSLLHGVTGSGKTEVYLRLIDALRKRDPSAGVVVLVPEIALTPQAVSRFSSRFGALSGPHATGVAVLHSGLTAAQRHAQWQRIRRGEAKIVIGARSAVFAPLPDGQKGSENTGATSGGLGLIIVDEEHDSSYKQDQLPRYHARDVAIKRAQLAGCPVVLGSATPALESYAHATEGRYRLINLPDRVPGAKLPTVEIVDLVAERKERARDRHVHLMSRRLEAALTQTLDDQGQAVLLLNRRGYANYIACPDQGCGWLMSCEHCDALMVYHLNAKLPDGGLVRCHHCLAEQRLPQVCPDCSRKVVTFGMGTQRIEQELQRKFPDARVARMDADVMRTGKDYRRTLEAFANHETDVLLGTQMIAKGLDVPNVRLVGVISADTSLNFPDFRAAERTFQLIAQVSGRAGRGAKRGLVVLQTFNPDDHTIRDAAAHDFVTFAQRELGLRKDASLPPAARMARIVARDPQRVEAFRRITELHAALAEANTQLELGVYLTPPAPCPIERVADHYRYDVRLLAGSAAALQRLLTTLRNARKLVSDARVAIDVDPVGLL